MDGRRELYLGDTWFGNLNTLRARTSTVEHDDGIGSVDNKVIFVIKGGRQLFPKDELAHILKDQPAGTSAVFKTTDPDINCQLLDIGYWLLAIGYWLLAGITMNQVQCSSLP